MRYLVLATDYDETLADEGRVPAEAIAALERVKTSGRSLLLVTGREVDDLRRVFDRLDLFDAVVAENGGVLYTPATGDIEALAERPDERFVGRLREEGVVPLHVGHVVVATREPYEHVVLPVIRDLGLELQVIFNKGAVMVLPSGVNKATGLRVALERLRMGPHNVVAIGDAENDHAFLGACEAGVAVANAVPSLAEAADFVTSAPASAGVVELADAVVRDDLQSLAGTLTRHHIPFGRGLDGREVGIEPYGVDLLITGTSGSGKSTLTLGLLERLADRGYQFCLVDPEGDYPAFGGAIVLGSQHTAPSLEELDQALQLPDGGIILNLLAMPLADRPAAFEQIALRVREAQGRFGRPHWLVVDEAHHMIRAETVSSRGTPQMLGTTVLVTPHPELLPANALTDVRGLVTVGSEVRKTVAALAKQRAIAAPETPEALPAHTALLWRLDTGEAQSVEVYRSEVERRRHQRKYAEGELGEERSFYFRGPQGALNIRAQNLMIFLQVADGLDDDTFLYHLRRGDYSRWFRDAIKDTDLGDEVEAVERMDPLPDDQGRSVIRAAVEARYTLPGTVPTGSTEQGPE